jgi:hypothetical protein
MKDAASENEEAANEIVQEDEESTEEIVQRNEEVTSANNRKISTVEVEVDESMNIDTLECICERSTNYWRENMKRFDRNHLEIDALLLLSSMIYDNWTICSTHRHNLMWNFFLRSLPVTQQSDSNEADYRLRTIWNNRHRLHRLRRKEVTWFVVDDRKSTRNKEESTEAIEETKRDNENNENAEDNEKKEDEDNEKKEDEDNEEKEDEDNEEKEDEDNEKKENDDADSTNMSVKWC